MLKARVQHRPPSHQTALHETRVGSAHSLSAGLTDRLLCKHMGNPSIPCGPGGCSPAHPEEVTWMWSGLLVGTPVPELGGFPRSEFLHPRGRVAGVVRASSEDNLHSHHISIPITYLPPGSWQEVTEGAAREIGHHHPPPALHPSPGPDQIAQSGPAHTRLGLAPPTHLFHYPTAVPALIRAH